MHRSLQLPLLVLVILYQGTDSAVTRGARTAGKQHPSCHSHNWLPLDISCTPCPSGHFTPLQGEDAKTTACRKRLTCEEMQRDVQILETIDTGRWGNVKVLQRGLWKGQPVVLAKGKIPEDFLHNVNMLEALSPHPLVVNVIGICRERVELLTEYYPLGGGHTFGAVLSDIIAKCTHAERGITDWQVRLRLAEDIVSAIDYLHTGPAGVRVMCDANYPEKLLSQFLITNACGLVLNDLDALPEVRAAQGVTVKCGHRQLPASNKYLAPEQLWPFPGEPFSDTRMPGYTEKVDIWKVPDVLRLVLGGDAAPKECEGLVREHLEALEARCKRHDPAERPTSTEVKNDIVDLVKITHHCGRFDTDF